MKPEVSPRRLIDDPELGELLKSASSLTVTPQRLSDNGHAINSKIASLGTTGSLAATSATGLKIGVIAKLALPLALFTIGGALAVISTQLNQGSPTSIRDEESTDKTQALQPQADPQRVEMLKPELAPKREALQSAIPKRTAPHKKQPTPQSTLSEQLRIFEAAKSAASTGSYNRAIELLEKIQRDYPKTHLWAEIHLSRASYLVNSGRDQEALEFVSHLLPDRRLSNKKAQLLLLMADIWLRNNDCEKAVPAYHRALGFGLGVEERTAVRAGLKKCTPH